MSSPTPSVAQISADIVAQISAKYGTTIPLLPKSFIRVAALAFAGVIVLLYKYAGFIGLQFYARFASYRETTINGKTLVPLIEIGRGRGVTDPTAATFAEVLCTVPVLSAVGSLAKGTQSKSAAGVTYETTAAVVLATPDIQVLIRAIAGPENTDGSGEIGNLSEGDEVEFVNAPATIGPIATAVETQIAGEEQEGEDSYRVRVVTARQSPPQGSGLADFRDWARSVPGIVAAYPRTSTPPSTVTLYCEASVISSGSADGIPTASQLEAIELAVEYDPDGRARRPANCVLDVQAITRTPINVHVVGLLPDTTANRALIVEAADSYLRTREQYILGVTPRPRKDRATQAEVSGVVSGVVNAIDAAVTSTTTDPGPSAVCSDGEKFKAGTITFGA